MVDTCRVCLCSDRRMHSISNTVFVEVWEKLTNAKFNTNDGKPLLVCYICSAQLRKAHQLMKKALKAEELLTTVINIGSKQSQKAILLLASETHDFHYKYAIGGVCQFECKQFERNTVGEIKKEYECRPEEYNKKEIDININEKESGNAEEEIEKENVGDCREGSEEENDIKINDEERGNAEEEIDKENVRESEEGCEKENDIKINEEKRGNAEEEIDKESVGESEEGSEEENDINIKEEGDCSDPNQEESAHISDDESGPLLSGDLILKDILEREVRIILEKIDIDAVAASTSLDGSEGGKISSIHNLRIDSEGMFSCHICQYKCFDSHTLNIHLRKHTGEKPYMCGFCDFRTTRKDNLKYHVRYKHTKEKKYSCHICQYKCIRNYELTLHLRTHTGEKPYKCDFCDYGSARKNRLEDHIKYKHTKEKNYSCNLCQYKCVRKSELNRHVFKHTEEKPYKCDFCDYKCTVSTTLRIHIRRRHAK